jgi:hypothetical protein
MKRFAIIVLFVSALFSASQVLGQNDGNLFDQFRKCAIDQVDEIATPVVQATGVGIGGGLYNTASTHGMLGFDIGIRTMMVFVPEGSGILDSADVKFFPVPVAQVSVGFPMNFEVMLRGFSITYKDKTVSLFGGGVKKSFSEYIPIPTFPDLSAIIAYHTFKAGGILSSTTLSFDVIVSKKFLIISPYGGFGYDRTSMDFTYTFSPDTPLEYEVEHNIKASTARLTLGLNITPVPFVKIFADYNLSKFSQVTAGLAFSFR